MGETIQMEKEGVVEEVALFEEPFFLAKGWQRVAEPIAAPAEAPAEEPAQ